MDARGAKRDILTKKRIDRKTELKEKENRRKERKKASI